MPIIDINRQFPPLMHEQRFGNNGQMPSGAGLRRMTQGLNTSGGVLRKMSMVRFENYLTAIDTGQAWVGYVRTGEDCSAIIHYLGLGAAVSASWTTDPYASLVTTALGGAALATNEVHYSATLPSAGDTELYPSRIYHVETRVDGPADNTEYTMALTMNNYARCLYWSFAEVTQDRVDSAGNVIADSSGFAANAPIYYQDINAALTKATNIRKHNSGCLFSYCCHDVNGAGVNNNPRTLSAAYGRVSQSGATPPNAATAGYSVDLTNRGTLLRGVPITFWAFAKTASGSTNNVRLVDQSGAALVTLSSFGTTAGYKTGTATISAAITGLFVEFKSDGANILELLAFGCVQYEA